MTNREKIEFLKDSITHLYSVEGRTKSYISRLFDVDRSLLSKIITNEWNLEQAQKTHLKPSTVKFLKREFQRIRSLIENNVSISEMARIIKCNRGLLHKVISFDGELSKLYEARLNLLKEQKAVKEEIFNFNNLEGELWKQILGYEKYMVSNKGRFKVYVKSKGKYKLMKPSKNSISGRLYISLRKEENGAKKNFIAARIVASAFVDGKSNEKNTVNHKDGNIENNEASNLEWVSQGENNTHAYSQLGRKKVKKNKSDFKKVIYKGKYEFKTIASLAKFIGKSETQTRRYLEEPSKHDLLIIR